MQHSDLQKLGRPSSHSWFCHHRCRLGQKPECRPRYELASQAARGQLGPKRGPGPGSPTRPMQHQHQHLGMQKWQPKQWRPGSTQRPVCCRHKQPNQHQGPRSDQQPNSSPGPLPNRCSRPKQSQRLRQIINPCCADWSRMETRPARGILMTMTGSQKSTSNTLKLQLSCPYTRWQQHWSHTGCIFITQTNTRRLAGLKRETFEELRIYF